ncbi:S-layer homology domain-containing protein [Brachybacterium sillae]|uniref:S-layer homology domain-containing protein n=1 Tax=Brachybacterium sillae TaxID=2810536 RepID=UPI00217D14F4|nr:S-layer homology domain-containing protein [Brachybacterium sillae]
MRPGYEHYDAVLWAWHRGIVKGFPDGTYRPLAPVNRDAMCAFLHRLAGSPEVDRPRSEPFRDVRPGVEHYEAIIWAYQMGIARGWPDGTFRPTQPINRDAIAAFIYRYAGSPSFPKPTTPPFRDVPVTIPFAKEIAWLKAEGITKGWPDGTYRPWTTVKRDAMAAFLFRIKEEQQIAFKAAG